MTQLQVGSVIADTDSFQMFVHEVPITVKPKVFDAFVLFCKSQGKVLSKQDLMDELWPESYVTESSLFKLIQDLRKALEEAQCEDVSIETIPARGYRLEVASAGAPNAQNLPDISAKGPQHGWLTRIIVASVLVAILVAVLIMWPTSSFEKPQDFSAEQSRIEALAEDAPSDALHAIEQSAIPADSWWRLFHTGEALRSLGRLTEAVEYLEKAKDVTGITKLEKARTIQAITRAWLPMGKSQAIVDIIEQSYPDYENLNPSLALSLGGAYQDLGELDKAVQLFELTVDTAEASNSPVLMYHALGNLGNVAYHKGDADKAVARYEKALDLALNQADGVVAATLQNNLANIAQERARFQTAARYYAQAYRLLKNKIEAEELGMVILNFANTHAEARQYAVAEYYYDMIVRWAEPRGYDTLLSGALMNAGLAAYKNGDYVNAINFFQTLTESPALQDIPSIQGFARANMARAMIVDGDALGGLEEAQVALDIAQKIQRPDIRMYARTAQGHAHLAMDRFEQARQVLDDALNISKDRRDWERLEILELQTLAVAALGDMGSAQQLQKDASDLRQQLQSAAEAFTFTLDEPLILPE